MTDLDRFWLKVQKTETCWLWTAACDKDGYGRFWWRGRTGRAAQFIFEREHGPLPRGKIPCHTCDVPRCIRVAHLFAGTQQQNIRDAIRKGRWPQQHRYGISIGEQNGNRTLTAQQVSEIRAKYQRGRAPTPSPVSLRSLAQEYGVTKYAIFSIIHGLTWRHLRDSVIVVRPPG